MCVLHAVFSPIIFLDADWLGFNQFSHVFEILDSDWLWDEVASMTTAGKFLSINYRYATSLEIQTRKIHFAVLVQRPRMFWTSVG